MKVDYFHQATGFYGNIIWAQRDRGSSYYPVSRFAKRAGKFPADHPAAPGPDGLAGDEMGVGNKLGAFRARGYWASCFPEGDGITMKGPEGKKAADVARDIEEVFGWEAVVKRGDE